MELAEMGGFFDGEWESLSNVFRFDEPGFGAHHQFLSHHTDSTFVAPFTDNEYFYSNLSILPYTSISNFHIDNASDTTNFNFSSQTTTNSYENCHFSFPNEVVSQCMTGQGNHVAIAASDVSAFPPSLDVNGSNDSPIGSVEDNESYTLASTLNTKVHEKRMKIAHEVVPKKKARVSNNNGKKIIESTENKEEDDSNVGVETKTDEESMASPQTNEEEISASKGKNRASRGTATDPQSLYARKRREKINERLKILQKLVPNGTKVDISTLLEEAVQYVKFLQLQIRLLSSDDLWMYAPIAYNGVDISLYKRISPFLIP